MGGARIEVGARRADLCQYMRMAEARERAPRAVYYRFEDANGRIHLVDSLDSVPLSWRARAQRIEYQVEPAASGVPLPRSLTFWQTFGLGFTAALLIALVFRRLPGTMRLALRFAIIGGVLALLAGAYLGWVRRATGSSRDTMATPGALIDDARDAVGKMNARITAEQNELNEAERAK